MPRAPRDSDDDVDEKIATRRTRASAAANAPSTPVRRSTRGCNRPLSTIDSSPENDENVLKPVGRTTRSRAATLDKGSIPTVVKNLRSRKNSAASDLSESMDLDSVSKRVTRQNITATPTKTNPRARAVRAGSEVNSTPPTVVNKRVTRASSVEPSVNEPVVVTPRRRRTRASIIPPVHLSVHEEQEDDSNNLISEENKSNQGSPDSHNSHNDSNKSSKFSEDVEQSQSNVIEPKNDREKPSMDMFNKNEDITNKLNTNNKVNKIIDTEKPKLKNLDDSVLTSANLLEINSKKNESFNSNTLVEKNYSESTELKLSNNETQSKINEHTYNNLILNDNIELINIDSNDSTSSISIVQVDSPTENLLVDPLKIDLKESYVKLNRTNFVDEKVDEVDKDFKICNSNSGENSSQNIKHNAIVLVQDCIKCDEKLSLKNIPESKIQEIIENAVRSVNDSIDNPKISENNEQEKNQEIDVEVIDDMCVSKLTYDSNNKLNHDLDNITLVDESDTESSLVTDCNATETINPILCDKKIADSLILTAQNSNIFSLAEANKNLNCSENILPPDLIEEIVDFHNQSIPHNQPINKNIDSNIPLTDKNNYNETVISNQLNLDNDNININLGIINNIDETSKEISKKTDSIKLVVSPNDSNEIDKSSSHSNLDNTNNNISVLNNYSSNETQNLTIADKKIESINSIVSISVSNKMNHSSNYLNLDDKTITGKSNLIDHSGEKELILQPINQIEIDKKRDSIISVDKITSNPITAINNSTESTNDFSITNIHTDSNKNKSHESDGPKNGITSAVTDADGVASSPEKMEPLNESKNKVKTPKKSPGSQKNLPKRKSNDHIESDEEMNDLFQDIPAEEWSNKISELNETTELSSENSIKGLKKDKQSSEANGVEESAEESDESEIESKSQKSLNKSLKLDQSNNDKKLFESPTKSRKSAGKNDEINISSEKLSSLNDSKSAKRKSLTGKSISEDNKVEIGNNKSVEAMEIDEQSDYGDSDNQMNTDSNSLEKNSQSLNKKKLNSLNKSFPIQNKNDSSKHNRCSLDSQKNSKNELIQVNFNKISEDLKFSKTNKNEISSKKSLNLSSIVDDDSSGSEISKVTYKNNLLNHISTDSPSKNIKDADEKETNKIRRSIELMKKKFPPKHDVSTIAQAGSSSDEEKNSESSDSEDDIKVDDKIDSDIEKEYNLAGKIITHYEDDDVPGDDCRASEEELSNSEDEGSDLQDFIVDDNDEEEDDSDSDYGNIIEIDEDEEDDEDDEEVGMDKRAREKADKEESSDEMEEDEDSEDGEVDNKIDRENKKADDIKEKMNLSKSKDNKSVNKSKSIIEADPEIVDSDDDEEVEIETRKSISKNESANLSKSVNNKSINKSKSMVAEQSFNDSKSIKNKSLNLSKSTNNKSVNKSKSIIEADPEIVDSNDDDDEDDEEVEIETRKSISKNESANLSKSVNNKSINKSKSMVAEQSFNDSKSIKNKSLNISKSLNDKSSLKPKIAIQESEEDDDDREDENEIITSDKNNSKLSKNKKMNNSIVDNKTKSLNPMILENSSSESSDSETENGEDSYRIITADQLDTSISKKKKILLESSTPKVLSTKKSLKNDKSLNDKKNLSAILDNSTTSKRKSGSLNDLTDSKAISKRQSLSEITAAMSNRENSKIFNSSVTFNDTIEILDSSEGPLKNRQLWKLIPLNTTHQPVGSETPGTKFLKKSKLNESVPVLKSTEASPVGNKSKNDMKSKKNKIQESHDEEGDDSKLNKKSKKRKLQELSALELLENEDSIIKNSKKNKKRARTESSAEYIDDQPIENTCETKKKKKNKDKLLKTESFDSLEDIKSQNNPKTKKSKKDKEVPMDDSISSDQNEKKKKKKNKKQKESNYEEKILDDQPEDFYNELLKTKKKKLSLTSHSDENTSNDKIKLKEKKKSKSDETGDSMKKKSKSKVSDSDDEAPESVSFAEARSAAVEAAQRAIDRVKAQKQARQKKHKEHVNRMLEQKELKHTSGIKRLSEEFLEQLPNENMTRPVKRQKLSKGKERLVMSSTSMTSQEKPLSSAGSTTKFGVVALDKVNTVSKKSAAVISFREKMLARNSRQPISSHLAYLEKQRAKADLHK